MEQSERVLSWLQQSRDHKEPTIAERLQNVSSNLMLKFLKLSEKMSIENFLGNFSWYKRKFPF